MTGTSSMESYLKINLSAKLSLSDRSLSWSRDAQEWQVLSFPRRAELPKALYHGPDLTRALAALGGTVGAAT